MDAVAIEALIGNLGLRDGSFFDLAQTLRQRRPAIVIGYADVDVVPPPELDACFMRPLDLDRLGPFLGVRFGRYRSGEHAIPNRRNASDRSRAPGAPRDRRGHRLHEHGIEEMLRVVEAGVARHGEDRDGGSLRLPAEPPREVAPTHHPEREIGDDDAGAAQLGNELERVFPRRAALDLVSVEREELTKELATILVIVDEQDPSALLGGPRRHVGRLHKQLVTIVRQPERPRPSELSPEPFGLAPQLPAEDAPTTCAEEARSVRPRARGRRARTKTACAHRELGRRRARALIIEGEHERSLCSSRSTSVADASDLRSSSVVPSLKLRRSGGRAPRLSRGDTRSRPFGRHLGLSAMARPSLGHPSEYIS